MELMKKKMLTNIFQLSVVTTLGTYKRYGALHDTVSFWNTIGQKQ